MKSLIVNIAFVVLLLGITLYQLSHGLEFDKIYIFWIPIALVMYLTFAMVSVRERAQLMLVLAERLGGTYAFVEDGEPNALPKVLSISNLFARKNRNFITVQMNKRSVRMYDTPRPLITPKGGSHYPTVLEVDGIKVAELKRWLWSSDNIDLLYEQIKAYTA